MIKLKILNYYDSFLQQSLGPFYRRIAKRFITRGVELQGSLASDDRLVQDLTQIEANGQKPAIDQAIFTAPNSVVVGDVQLAKNSSVWYGATLRGDQGKISVGINSIVQDNAYLKGVTIGNNSYIGANTNLQQCQIGQNAFVGMGAVVRKGSSVEGILAAGSILSENTKVGQGEVWGGAPAKYLRDITPDELQLLREYKIELVKLAQIHAEETTKNYRQIIEDHDSIIARQLSTEEEQVLEELQKLNFPLEGEEEEFIEQRVFMKENTNLFQDSENLEKNQDLYEQDLSLFPENWRKYAEDVNLYEEAQKYFEQNPTAKAEQIKFKEQIKDESAYTRKY